MDQLEQEYQALCRKYEDREEIVAALTLSYLETIHDREKNKKTEVILNTL